MKSGTDINLPVFYEEISKDHLERQVLAGYNE